jgi:hypothetical protein
MNGRVYDGEIGRFLSADPFVQDNTNSQALNRYTYVLNNPLSMTDPTGYFFGSVFKAIGNFIGKVFSAIASVFKAALKVPLIRAVIQIAACAGPGLSPLCVGVAGAMALLGGGGIEDAIKAMAFTVGSFGVWTGVGELITGPLQAAMGVAEGVMNAATVGFAAVKGAIHGVVGGALSLAQGGEFVDGFVANAAGAFAGVMAEGGFGPAGPGDIGDYSGRIAAAGIAGGTASALVGGKFANGAITAAFAQMWNGELSFQPPSSSPPPEEIAGGKWYWSPNAENARGGVWVSTTIPGRTASWDPEGHWDVNDRLISGQTYRQRYDYRGNPITKDVAHSVPPGPVRRPLSRWNNSVPNPYYRPNGLPMRMLPWIGLPFAFRDFIHMMNNPCANPALACGPGGV